jgi:RNA polymerase sigma factor for flagellar operon FliA
MHETMEGMWERYRRTRDLKERNALVEHYIPLVRMLAQKVKGTLPPCVENGDLENAGVIGLIRAIDRFEESQGVKFETFCSQRIHGAMMDHLRDADFLPRALRVKLHKLDRARRQLCGELGREPTDDELAAQLGTTQKKVRRLNFDQNVSLVSLDHCAGSRSDDSTRRLKVWEDKRAATPLQCLEKQELYEMIDNALSRTERLIVMLYYYEKLTMREIGKTLDISEARVSQLHRKIVRELKKRLAAG